MINNNLFSFTDGVILVDPEYVKDDKKGNLQNKLDASQEHCTLWDRYPYPWLWS